MRNPSLVLASCRGYDFKKGEEGFLASLEMTVLYSGSQGDDRG